GGPVKVWIDGAVVDGAEARVPVTDHGFLYGDGVFEGMRVYSRRVFRLERHLRRIATGARAIGLEIPGGAASLGPVVLETARAFGADDAYVRLVVSRGEGALGVDPTTCPTPRVVCIVDRIRLWPDEVRRRGLALATSSLRRPAPSVLDPRVKSLNYLNNALAKLEARRAGADEALLLNAAGLVAEASVANVFAVLEGRLVTPPPTDGALEGITREAVLELAADAGIPTAERSLGRFDLLAADEVFLTGAGAGVAPVGSLDGARIGGGAPPGPVTARLAADFERLARRDGAAGTPLDG
ncbi:MAG: branched-chain-amino-acid transaminase, partial [Myxococcota bacterium]|nr:branched-chain-amino-acid transaminase [Myxococcota bacterium]